ncbi:hypothetical protein C3F09_02455 [candidate division GN15 bacterium]|uniref:HD/PDEase domain-containing protein n=1 Tax=candidate division GN15 bacterium TaxID=2072418 RepID=A0A855XBM5_9BACT|nr:MAG: hypothetical protein C3F09_02455 [candidate division GN15 bacterium]
MFAFLLRLKRRIKKRLRVQADTRTLPVPTVHSRIRKVIILLIGSALIALFYPGEDLYNPLDMPRKGDIAQRDIVAPFPITILKSEKELEQEQQTRRLTVPFVLRCDTAIVRSVYTGLESYVALVDSLRTLQGNHSTLDSAAKVILVSERFPLMSQTAVARSLQPDVNLVLLQRRLERIYDDEIYNVGVIADLGAIPETGPSMVSIRRGDAENVYERQRVLDLAMANAHLLTALNRMAASDSLDVEYYYLIGRHFLQPTLFADVTEYNRRVRNQEAQISAAKETIETNDIIVRAGRKVGDREEEILTEMARILRTQAAAKGVWSLLLPVLARMFLVLLVFSTLYLFLFFFRRDIYRSNPRLVALFLVFVLQLILVRVAEMVPVEQSMYLYPIAVLPIMVTVLFDAEVGIIATVVEALLLGIMHRFDFSLVLMTISVGTVACLVSRQVQKRSHFYRIMGSVMLTYAVLIFLVENLKLSPPADIGILALYGMFTGMISCLLVIGILPFFESMFSITTDITLLELSDLNHPVLKRLALEAPGTYHHSISVGNLSEAAAEAIGANALLARVGCYYHDIGKIEVPEYFIENQLGVHSRHEQLAPTMSSLILAAHVKRGRAIGEEADVPDDVLNFIEEHHGTMVMTYFYNKAKEQAAEENEEVDVDKFRYPGPKPQVRETGIAMLADAVEAASRTLDDPKPARIYALIQRIINDRFQSGELDECPLTLRDLAKIREAFAQILIGAFHRRVDYPRKE